MAELHVLRVFVNEEGEWGNPLGVFLDGGAVAEGERQRVAAELGFSETVFVEDAASGRMRIFTPEVELPFAGHPCVGTAWLLDKRRLGGESLRPPAGEVPVRRADIHTFVSARPEWSPPFAFRPIGAPPELRTLDPAEQTRNTYAWAWIDEDAGTIRARSFVPEAGIAEDEATGSAALSLCAQLNRPIVIHQGHGSVIECLPAPDGRTEVGGAVTLDEVREHAVA